jgi:hypothetical protein
MAVTAPGGPARTPAAALACSIVRTVLTVGGGWSLNEARRQALEDLAEELPDELAPVEIVEPTPMQGRGLAWGEIALVYIGMKALDLATEQAINATARQVIEAGKRWARKRMQGRLGNPRAQRPSVDVLDAEGKSLGGVAAAPSEDGTAVEVIERPPDQVLRPPPVDWEEQSD